jgi:membrane protein implicated in regulation of membrane protease activity
MSSRMRKFVNVLAILSILMGLIWILQGVNILPGSFMTGDIRWAWNGIVAVVVGILLLVLVNRGVNRRGNRRRS